MRVTICVHSHCMCLVRRNLGNSNQHVLACCASGVVTWKQCLSDNQAWDTLTWFAALIAMAAYLNKFGFISWFSDQARRITAKGSRAVVCGLLFG